jgi:lipopolysaccharide/colanic/teichoic acid biosynthesis glycosyltransferase
VPDEAERLEYDLYYVKRGSPSLDLEIFLRSLTERPFSSRRLPHSKAAGTA